MPRNLEARRSGTTPPPIAFSPWQTEQYCAYRPWPAATVAASAVAGGGSSTSFCSGGKAGSTAVPPTLNTSTRLTLRRLPDLAASLPWNNGNAPPHPDITAMYCSPFTSYVIGPAMTALWAGVDQTFSPVSARYALKLPEASPWTTRFPAVVRVPPFHGPR